MGFNQLRPSSDISVGADSWTLAGGASTYYGAINEIVRYPDAVASGPAIQLPSGKSGGAVVGLPSIPGGAQIQSVRVFAYLDGEAAVGGTSLHVFVNGAGAEQIIDDEEVYASGGEQTLGGWVSSSVTATSVAPTSLELFGQCAVGTYITIRAAYVEVVLVGGAQYRAGISVGTGV
jgi:hypothetical protein